MADIFELQELANDWAKRTDTALLLSIQKNKIGVTEDLYRSLRHQVYMIAGENIGVDFSFLLRGRFVDMGAGRAKIESSESNRDVLAFRKPKKWYSRTFYGRLHALNGVIGANISEQAIKAVIEPLKSPSV